MQLQIWIMWFFEETPSRCRGWMSSMHTAQDTSDNHDHCTIENLKHSTSFHFFSSYVMLYISGEIKVTINDANMEVEIVSKKKDAYSKRTTLLIYKLRINILSWSNQNGRKNTKLRLRSTHTLFSTTILNNMIGYSWMNLINWCSTFLHVTPLIQTTN